MTFDSTTRRGFLTSTAALGLAGVACADHHASPAEGGSATAEGPLFDISIAEWSVHNAIRKGKITNLDFPGLARDEFGLGAVEYVNSLFADQRTDADYLAELKGRCDDAGVKSLLIMIDREGQVGAASESERVKTAERHKRWIAAAAELGCHSVRVNASSDGSFFDQARYAADGLVKLAEVAEPYGLNVLVENHGGYSSHGAWLATVMELAGNPRVGTLPDFGNFRIKGRRNNPIETYDNYKGVAQLMPYAKAVSAKTNDFDEEGNETTLDYMRMMELVVAWGYRGYVGIEYEGRRLGEYEGVKASKVLLERCREMLTSRYV
ncbi:MAG: TIM barrel protein [Planctomycetota bacterium]